MRVSDVNKQRKLRFGQAVLLGCEFFYNHRGTGEYSPKMWHMRLPPDKFDRGYVAGPWDRRWMAVDAALRKLGVL